MVLKKTESKNFMFFLTTQTDEFSLYPFLIFFSTRLLETYLGGLKAACIGPALSKLRRKFWRWSNLGHLLKNKLKGTQENPVLDFHDPKDTYLNIRNREAI